MSEQPIENPVDDGVVDLDLDAEDSRLREAVGKPLAVKIDGITVHIIHAAEWSNTAMKAANSGDWDTWAEEVIIDDKERETFIDADLLNYQLEAVFSACAKASNVTPGKSRRRRR